MLLVTPDSVGLGLHFVIVAKTKVAALFSKYKSDLFPLSLISSSSGSQANN
jgi:hypothetical protein